MCVPADDRQAPGDDRQQQRNRTGEPQGDTQTKVLARPTADECAGPGR